MEQDRRRSVELVVNGRWIICALCAALWLAFSMAPALAHKVAIFAWVEGDTVHTQSKFSGGKRPKDSTVVVYDKEGNLLLEGQTDENGEFSFKIPKKTDLKVALKASMGHLAEWTIPAEEITEVATEAAGGVPVPSQAPDMEKPAVATEVGGKEEPPSSAAISLSREEMQELINKSLDRKLTPIVNMLTDAIDRGPSMSDIVGGIGYIFGLAGVAFYFSRRRKND